jgi:hypothetical protein
MKYAAEMGSGAMIHVHTNFHKNYFTHPKVDGGIHRHTESMVIA